MEYKIGVMSYGRGQLVRDPLNEHTARDPFGANSVVYGEGYEPPEWTVEDPEARKGTVEERHVDSPVFGDWRPIQVYRPCLLYTSPSPRDKRQSRMPSSA